MAATPNVYGSYGNAQRTAASVGDYMRERESQHEEPSTGRQVGEILIKSAPFAILGAVVGIAAKTMSMLASDGKAKKKQQYEKYPYISQDTVFVEQLRFIENYAVVASPSWMSVICDHVEFASEAWFAFNKLTQRAKTYANIVDEELAGTSSMGTIQDAVTYLFTLLIPKKYVDDNCYEEEQLHVQANEKVKSEAFRTMTAYFDKSTLIIAAAYKTRIAMAGLMAELCDSVALFNTYWFQVGSIVMSDPSLMHQSRAQDAIQRKIEIASNLLAVGLLPTRVDGITEDVNTSTSIKWWISMHTMFQPSMKCVAAHFGWHSVFNPEQEASGGDNGYVNNGVLERDADASRRAEFAEHAQPGHAFGEDKSQFKSRRANGGTPSVDAKQTLTENGRPTTGHSFFDQSKFWKARIAGERSVKAIIDQPWAGFKPAVSDKAHLPTVMLERIKLTQSLRVVMDKIDEKIQDMLNAQLFLLRKATEMGDLRSYYVEKIRRGEDDILGLHLKWEEWTRRQPPS